jgi:hypothetical protein
MLNFCDTQALMQVTAWVLGEFHARDDGVFENLQRLISMPQTRDTTKGYALTALAKLAVRFGKRELLREFLQTLIGSVNLDVQQRAGELYAILAIDDACEDILAPLEASGEPTIAPSIVVTPEDDGDDLLLAMDEPASRPTQKPSTGAALSDDLLGLMGLESTPAPAPVAAAAPALRIPPGAVEALRKPDYVVYFEIRKNPQNPKQMVIRSSAYNTGSVALSNFAMKYGVPFGWSIQTQPATGNVLEPNGTPIFQQIMVQTQSDMPLLMKTQINYVYGSQPISEVGEINPIFG